MIGRALPKASVDTVTTESRLGAESAVRHLHAAGRRRIGFVNGPRETHAGRAHATPATRKVSASVGLELDESLVEEGDDFTVEPGRAATVRLLERASPDAIFCANDLIATGALTALHDANLAVPGDVAVVGMDNTYLCDVVYPRLTSVDTQAARRGREAAELLVKRIEQPTRRVRIVDVPPTPGRPRDLRSGGDVVTAIPEPGRRLDRFLSRRGSVGVGLSRTEALVLLVPRCCRSSSSASRRSCAASTSASPTHTRATGSRPTSSACRTSARSSTTACS